MPRGKLKAKGAATQGTRVEEPGSTAQRSFAQKKKEPLRQSLKWGKTSENIFSTDPRASGNEPSATPIKIFFSLLKAGKLKAERKTTKDKLKAHEMQAKSQLKAC